MKIKVGINGMGRIGRMIIRSIIESNNQNIEIKHINNRTNSETCSTLLKYDSIHGKFETDINFDDKHLIINKNNSKNESSSGAYEILRTGEEIKLTIISSGSETSLACDISHKLATENIYSKVISMPCQELFDQQNKDYKNKILTETELIVSVEASETDYWKKYTGRNGLNFGINDFGKSAPYKEIYNHFELSSESIIKKIKEKI